MAARCVKKHNRTERRLFFAQTAHPPHLAPKKKHGRMTLLLFPLSNGSTVELVQSDMVICGPSRSSSPHPHPRFLHGSSLIAPWPICAQQLVDSFVQQRRKKKKKKSASLQLSLPTTAV